MALERTTRRSSLTHIPRRLETGILFKLTPEAHDMLSELLDSITGRRKQADTTYAALVKDIANNKSKLNVAQVESIISAANKTPYDLARDVEVIQSRTQAVASIRQAEKDRAKLPALEREVDKTRTARDEAYARARDIEKKADAEFADAKAAFHRVNDSISNTITAANETLQRTADPALLEELQALRAQRNRMVPPSIDPPPPIPTHDAYGQGVMREHGIQSAKIRQRYADDVDALERQIADIEARIIDPLAGAPAELSAA